MNNDTISTRLKYARLKVINKISNIASNHHIKHVFVAGDIWEHEDASQEMIQKPLNAMAQYPGLTWWLLPGNHDFHRQNGLWARIEKLASTNVRLLLNPKPFLVEPSVYLLPAPWPSKSPGRNLTDWMKNTNLPEHDIKIGIAHGSVKNFSNDSYAPVVIDPTLIESAKLDYLALGDWHGHKQINEKTWYSGTPETDRFKNNQSGHILLVEINPYTQSPPKVKTIATTEYHWKKLHITCVPDTRDFPDLNKLKDSDSLDQHLLQIHLKGQLREQNWQKLQQMINDLKNSTVFIETHEKELVRQITPHDLNHLPQRGAIRMTAKTLQAMRSNPDLSVEEKKVATDALQFLLSEFNAIGDTHL